MLGKRRERDSGDLAEDEPRKRSRCSRTSSQFWFLFQISLLTISNIVDIVNQLLGKRKECHTIDLDTDEPREKCRRGGGNSDRLKVCQSVVIVQYLAGSLTASFFPAVDHQEGRDRPAWGANLRQELSYPLRFPWSGRTRCSGQGF